MRLRTASWAALMSCALVLPSIAFAANLEPAGINLGLTSFFDGFGRNEEGFTYLAYVQYGMARALNLDDGNRDPRFTDPEFDSYLLVNQLVYVLPEKLFDDRAHAGIDFIVPLVGFDTDLRIAKILPPVVSDNGVGLGDLTFGPLLQFRPVIVDGRPVFSHRFEIDLIVPTGKFNPDRDINQGSNFTSINPYWAATVLPLPHLEISARFHYLYNFKTDRPALGTTWGTMNPPALVHAQAGQAGWVNFAASYEFVHGLHVGANGYYFMQFNLDLWEMRDGSSSDGRGTFNDSGKVRVFGIGPGALYEIGEHDKLFANVYFQPIVYNRPKFTTFGLHWIHGFP